MTGREVVLVVDV